MANDLLSQPANKSRIQSFCLFNNVLVILDYIASHMKCLVNTEFERQRHMSLNSQKEHQML